MAFEYIYIGCYLRVWMPKIKRPADKGRCPDCQETVNTPFCPQCGHETNFPVVELFDSFGISNICKEVFGYEMVFFSLEPEANSDEYLVVLANYDQPGFYVTDWLRENKIIKEDWSGDWDKLLKALDDKGIKYEKRFGVVGY